MDSSILISRHGEKSVVVDWQNEDITFHHFQFEASFLREPPRIVETIPFSDVLAVLFFSHHPAILQIRTTKGSVSIPAATEHFELLRKTFEKLVRKNQVRVGGLWKSVAREPKIHVPWYGWAILSAALAFAVVVGWITWPA
jgi:hypothetical protein